MVGGFTVPDGAGIEKYHPGFPDHVDYAVFSASVPATLLYWSSSTLRRGSKNSTYSIELQGKLRAIEKGEPIRAHLSALVSYQVPYIALADHLGLEESIQRMKPPSDPSLSPYLQWAREWVISRENHSGWIPEYLNTSDSLTKYVPIGKDTLPKTIKTGMLSIPLTVSGGQQLPPLFWTKLPIKGRPETTKPPDLEPPLVGGD